MKQDCPEKSRQGKEHRVTFGGSFPCIAEGCFDPPVVRKDSAYFVFRGKRYRIEVKAIGRPDQPQVGDKDEMARRIQVDPIPSEKPELEGLRVWGSENQDSAGIEVPR
jgi:hypothetical protein